MYLVCWATYWNDGMLEYWITKKMQNHLQFLKAKLLLL